MAATMLLFESRISTLQRRIDRDRAHLFPRQRRSWRHDDRADTGDVAGDFTAD